MDKNHAHDMGGDGGVWWGVSHIHPPSNSLMKNDDEMATYR
jgi:hypothetical protein